MPCAAPMPNASAARCPACTPSSSARCPATTRAPPRPRLLIGTIVLLVLALGGVLAWSFLGGSEPPPKPVVQAVTPAPAPDGRAAAGRSRHRRSRRRTAGFGDRGAAAPARRPRQRRRAKPAPRPAARREVAAATPPASARDLARGRQDLQPGRAAGIGPARAAEALVRRRQLQRRQGEPARVPQRPGVPRGRHRSPPAWC